MSFDNQLNRSLSVRLNESRSTPAVERYPVLQEGLDSVLDGLVSVHYNPLDSPRRSPALFLLDLILLLNQGIQDADSPSSLIRLDRLKVSEALPNLLPLLTEYRVWFTSQTVDTLWKREEHHRKHVQLDHRLWSLLVSFLPEVVYPFVPRYNERSYQLWSINIIWAERIQTLSSPPVPSQLVQWEHSHPERLWILKSISDRARIPHPLPTFIHRASDISHSLSSYFSDGNPGLHVFVLYGHQGSGKSQLAYDFIHKGIREGLFSQGVYINGQTPETIQASFDRMGLNLVSQEDILTYLALLDTPWILLLDNITSLLPFHHLQALFPVTTKGNILITTRIYFTTGHCLPPTSRAYLSETLTEPQALQLVLKEFKTDPDLLPMYVESYLRLIRQVGCTIQALIRATRNTSEVSVRVSVQEYVEQDRHARRLLEMGSTTQKGIEANSSLMSIGGVIMDARVVYQPNNQIIHADSNSQITFQIGPHVHVPTDDGTPVMSWRGQRGIAVLSWLNPCDHTASHEDAQRQRHVQTGHWILDQESFCQWKKGEVALLHLPGLPGCGKTILMSIMIQDTQTHVQSLSDTGMAYFYFDFRRKLDTAAFLRSILAQLSLQLSTIPEALHTLWESHYKVQPPSISRLVSTLTHVIRSFQTVHVIVDALDECEDLEVLLTTLGQLSPGLCLLVSSRPHATITNALDPLDAIPLQIPPEAVGEDIRVYVTYRLTHDSSFESKWKPAEKDEIKTALLNRSHGMFRWVVCQMDRLKSCKSYPRLHQTLRSLPKDLFELYNSIMDRIDEEYLEDALTLFEWLTVVQEPISVLEATEALATDQYGDHRCFSEDARYRQPEEDIVGLCPSFLTLVTRHHLSSDSENAVTSVRCPAFAHHSVQEYFTSPNQDTFNSCIDATKAKRRVQDTCWSYLFHLGAYRAIEVEALWKMGRAQAIYARYPLTQFALREWWKSIPEDIREAMLEEEVLEEPLREMLGLEVFFECE